MALSTPPETQILLPQSDELAQKRVGKTRSPPSTQRQTLSLSLALSFQFFFPSCSLAFWVASISFPFPFSVHPSALVRPPQYTCLPLFCRSIRASVGMERQQECQNFSSLSFLSVSFTLPPAFTALHFNFFFSQSRNRVCVCESHNN